MRKKFLSTMLVAAVAAAALSGCGAKETAATTAAETTAAKADEETKSAETTAAETTAAETEAAEEAYKIGIVTPTVTVSEDELRKAIKLACLYAKLTLEGAASLALAAVTSGKCALTEQTVLLCSGGNIDGSVLLSCLQG